MRNNYLFILFLFAAFAASAQQTADALIAQVIKIAPRSVEKYDTRPKNNVFYLRTGFNDAVYTNAKDLQALKDKVILKVELIYTTYRKSETFDQHALNRKRLKALITAAPQLLSQPSVEWVLYGQTGCTSSEMGKEFFHGVAITYREPESAALLDAELKFLEMVAAGEIPAYAYDAFIKNELKETDADTAKTPPKIKMPEFIGGERARIDFFTRNLNYPQSAPEGVPRQVIAQFVVDKEGKIQHISLPGTSSPTAYDQEVLRFLRTMPNWTPGSVNGKRIDCMVTFTVDFMNRGSIVPSPLEVYAMDAGLPATTPTFDYSRIKPNPQGKFVSETLAKNAWKHAVLVCDVTGSMAPYNAQVLEFLKNQFAKKDTAIVSYLFFNDGDQKKNNAKRVGSVGGLYTVGNQSFDEVLTTMGAAMKGGSGGDLPENNIEALLKAEKDCPSCANTILIADNMASPRDMSLLPQLKKPVHVIVCGSSPILNEDYMNIARATKGSLHFGNKSFANLHTFEEGATVQVLKEVYVVKKGAFVRKE